MGRVETSSNNQSNYYTLNKLICVSRRSKNKILPVWWPFFCIKFMLMYGRMILQAWFDLMT